VIITALLSDLPGPIANLNIGYIYKDSSLYSSVTLANNLEQLFPFIFPNLQTKEILFFYSLLDDMYSISECEPG
jgi:hypothetical protein